MANADDFCQFARLGQTVKIQKCLQSHSIDINALNLYGESALSTATYYNQILCVEYLLANKADPKLRLTAGHTAIHIACRLGNVPILHMLLTLKNEENNPNIEEQQKQEDKHVYECLKIKDYSNLTPIHWAATQESVSKRQKMFAYLDKRMPGVLDSRYNLNWFYSWTKTHPWVIEDKSSCNFLPKLIQSEQTYRPEESSEITSLDITPKISNNNYERTPRAPLIVTTTNQLKTTKLRVPHVQIEQPLQISNLPSTPKTSCKVTVTSIYHIPKRDHKHLQLSDSQKTPSDSFTHRAHRVQIGPTINFPPPPPPPPSSSSSDIDDQTNNQHDYEDMNTPLSSKRPSHNLLSNIVPSIPTPSTDQSSQQSTKHVASSFGFDTSIEPCQTVYSNTDIYAQNNEPIEVESISSNDEDNDYGSNQMDYLCKSTSTLGITSPGTQTFYS